MPLFLNVFLVLGFFTNLLLLFRFKGNKYFLFLLLAFLVNPNYYSLIFSHTPISFAVIPFLSPALLIAFPRRGLKYSILLFLGFVILNPHLGTNNLIPLLMVTLSLAFIIICLCEDLHIEIMSKRRIPLFLPILILETLRNTIFFYFYYENQQLLEIISPISMMLGTIFMILMVYYGPERNVKYSFSKKEDGIEGDKNHKNTEIGLRRELAPELLANLTKREIEIVLLIGEGLKSQDIAEKLFISCKTVSNHRLTIKEKIGFSDYESIKNYLKTSKMGHNSI